MPPEKQLLKIQTKVNVSKVILLFVSITTTTVFLGVFSAFIGISIGKKTIKNNPNSYKVIACRTDNDCRKNEFCQFEECPDGNSGGTGICVKVPDLCTQDYSPVCGCDNETYSNSCRARQAKANVACQGVCPCREKILYQGNDLKIISRDLTKPLDDIIVVERISSDSVGYSKIYTLNNGELTYQSMVEGYIHEIISSAADISTGQWIIITTKSDVDLTIDKVWSANSLQGGWQRNFSIEKGFCNKDMPCDPERGNVDLALVKYFNKDNLDDSFIITGPSGCEPNVSLDIMNSWLQYYSKRANYTISADSSIDYIYYGGECPLDDAFTERIPIARQGNRAINVDFRSKEKLWSEAEEIKMENRRVMEVMVKDDYLIYSGEGWIGKAPQSNPRGNWQFPIFQAGNEYIYAQGILEADNLIIVYGFDKANIGLREAMQFKISKDQGETFSSNESNLRDYLGYLLPTLPYTSIKHMGYDETNRLIYLVINDGLNKNDLLFFIPYKEVLNWLYL